MRLRPYVPHDVELCHIVDKYAEGDKDEDWIPKLGIEGGWVVITFDAGRNSKVGQKLPELCLVHKVTHIVMSGTLNQATTLEKVNLIAPAWPLINGVFSSSKGSRYHMRRVTRNGTRSPMVSVEICKVTAKRLSADARRNSGATNG